MTSLSMPSATAVDGVAHRARAGRRLAISVDGFLQEGMDQKLRASLSGMPRDAQIEQRIRIEIADRRAMGAFDVIGEDFQFGLEIGFRAGRPASSAFAVWRLSEPIGALRHRDLALIDGARLPPATFLNSCVLVVSGPRHG